MTLPTRPAPAPPGSRAQVAAATANASLEQLRLQLQQQQQLQRQNSIGAKLIKLPPPPKVPQPPQNGGINGIGAANGSITRKFPQARYAPATNWDDSPFDLLGGVGTTSTTTTTSGKKPPPPRPPPPKIQPKKNPAPTPPPPPATSIQHSSSGSKILSTIFHRKKSSRAPTPNSSARIYGTATYGTAVTGSTANSTTVTTINNNTNSWKSAWNTPQNGSSTTTHTTTQNGEPQLISFDSPPSSPTFTQKSNSDCLSVDSFSSDSNFSSPQNGSVSQPESGFEDDFSAAAAGGGRSRPATTSPLDPWETIDAFGPPDPAAVHQAAAAPRYGQIGTAPVRNLSVVNTRVQNTPDNPLCNGKSLVPPAPTLNMPTIIKPKISQKPKAPKPPTLAKPTSSANGLTGLYSDLPTPPSPPMPQCAPPPPPPQVASTAYSSAQPTVSLLDVISGKVDALHLDTGMNDYGGSAASDERPYGIALYDFQSTEEGDLCFRENEKIYLLEQVSEAWYKGRTRSGCEGIFPINYVEIKVPLQSTGKSQISPSLSATSSSAVSPNYSSSTTTYDSTYQTATTTTTNSTSNNLQIRCLYNFPAEVEGDLAIKENEMVTILYRINEDWLYGEVNGRQGQFPANFLEYVPSNIPMP
ncbi:uncharacterized protein LOC133331369 [Musca vetustissima]|uniref:uncharacterized protein LOC133331369 n=1 Tax=Musca vetustissima TaxID=27455 RepID=UPI002AB6427B|nr:uncharacterized protein LOC133331369 [Musca vetustissima]